MIRYTLKCKENHRFDSWFQSAEAFEKLRGARMVVCAICGGVEVEKAIMSPGVQPTRAGATAPQIVENAEPSAKGALTQPPSASQQALADLRAKIEATFEDVGADFASEARAIHEGEAPRRPIIGQARANEARDLIEDGIPVAPLPWPSQKPN